MIYLAIFQISVFVYVIIAGILTNRKIKRANKRMDLLSMENAWLIAENERLKDKLKNLGFSEIDLNR